MAKLPPDDQGDEKPRNKRRYVPQDHRDENERERGVPRKSGGRPSDEDDWDEDWDEEDWEDDTQDENEDEDWQEEDGSADEDAGDADADDDR